MHPSYANYLQRAMRAPHYARLRDERMTLLGFIASADLNGLVDYVKRKGRHAGGNPNYYGKLAVHLMNRGPKAAYEELEAAYGSSFGDRLVDEGAFARDETDFEWVKEGEVKVYNKATGKDVMRPLMRRRITGLSRLPQLGPEQAPVYFRREQALRDRRAGIPKGSSPDALRAKYGPNLERLERPKKGVLGRLREVAGLA